MTRAEIVALDPRIVEEGSAPCKNSRAALTIPSPVESNRVEVGIVRPSFMDAVERLQGPDDIAGFTEVFPLTPALVADCLAHDASERTCPRRANFPAAFRTRVEIVALCGSRQHLPSEVSDSY
jgi:hypothetical protein